MKVVSVILRIKKSLLIYKFNIFQQLLTYQDFWMAPTTGGNFGQLLRLWEFWATCSVNPHIQEAAMVLRLLTFNIWFHHHQMERRMKARRSRFLGRWSHHFCALHRLQCFHLPVATEIHVPSLRNQLRCGNMILVLPSTRKRRVTSQIETQKCQIFSTSSRFDTYMASWGAKNRDSAEKLKSAGRLAFRQSGLHSDYINSAQVRKILSRPYDRVE